MIMASFYDISCEIDKDYSWKKYISMEYDDFENELNDYLLKHTEIKTGDILFTGSTYETRQYYGFMIVDKRNGIKTYSSEQGVDLIFENDDLKRYLINNEIKYKDLFEKLSKFFSELIGFSYDPDEIYDIYNDLGLWE